MKDREFTAYLMGLGMGAFCISVGVLIGSKTKGTPEYDMVFVALFGVLVFGLGWWGNWQFRKIDEEDGAK